MSVVSDMFYSEIYKQKGKLYMSLWRITVKNSGCLNGIRLERGMSVQVVSTAHPLTSSGLGLVRDAFIRIYGIDLKAANALGGAYLDVKKEG